eukprot:CAMPEP_0170566772 /NCGR_PEP_ID=MMETSP0211-20121228/80050_1 /TAXON_ID=311385 /ORGANISM="Pseudokeronopsis sp., Strain OXSARD2" /LENGTH=76 /DNA_ID=CAMNT_0010888035 /DNA_START=710 /DNA_END=940 /DNA_ORIENTATION=+
MEDKGKGNKKKKPFIITDYLKEMHLEAQVIDYSSLSQLKDWSIILGNGLQGVVELMEWTSSSGDKSNVAVKKVKIN